MADERLPDQHPTDREYIHKRNHYRAVGVDKLIQALAPGRGSCFEEIENKLLRFLMPNSSDEVREAVKVLIHAAQQTMK